MQSDGSDDIRRALIPSAFNNALHRFPKEQPTVTRSSQCSFYAHNLENVLVLKALGYGRSFTISLTPCPPYQYPSEFRLHRKYSDV